MNPSMDKTAVLDKLMPNELNRVKSIQLDPGGKGINAARVLHNFGAEVNATGLIAGRVGLDLLSQLKLIGIPHDFLEVEGETRTNLKIFDESVNGITEINEPGFWVSPEMLEQFFQKLEALTDGTEIVVLSGSLPPGLKDDFYGRCITFLKNKGIKVILDADGASLAKGLKALPYAIKPNLKELEELCGENFDRIEKIAKAAKQIVDSGIELVAISLGEDGMILANSEEVLRTHCWSIDVKSTVGAGDSVTAALAYSILEGDSLNEMARLATAAGTITALKSGTQLCELDEVLEAKEKVIIEVL